MPTPRHHTLSSGALSTALTLPLVLALAPGASAQASSATPDAATTKQDAREAARLIRHLELKSRRTAAADRLMKMGRAALPALIRAIEDPRTEILCHVAQLLHGLGLDARPAVPSLARAARDRDRRRSYAARWALAPFTPQEITVTASNQDWCVRELDANGGMIHEIGSLEYVTGAERLPNGNYLVSQHGGFGVTEIDRFGEAIWQCKAVADCTSAERQPNGNTLLVDTSRGRVVEVDPAGKTVWTHAARHLNRAIRLRSGNTLIVKGYDNLVQEINREGHVVWDWTGETCQPTDARLLDNGNLLISCYGWKEVVEVTRDKKIVRRLAVGGAPKAARRLADGRTLVSGRSVGAVNYVSMFEASGKLVWRSEGQGDGGSIRHY